MLYLFLDEPGNLGHHFQSTGVSRHFMITILEVPAPDHPTTQTGRENYELLLAEMKASAS